MMMAKCWTGSTAQWIQYISLQNVNMAVNIWDTIYKKKSVQILVPLSEYVFVVKLCSNWIVNQVRGYMDPL